jgi:hypothetical protein
MEQLIIFLLFVVGSIISSIIQHKKKQAEEQQQRELEELTRRDRGEQAPPVKPQAPFPKSPADWQEQLRRLLEGETEPQPNPPVIKPVLLPHVEKPQPPKPPAHVPAPPRKPVIRTTEVSEGDLSFPPPIRTFTSQHEPVPSAARERVREVARKDLLHPLKSTTQTRAQSPEFIRRLRRNPRAMREAFIASIIFGPPKALESHESTLHA